MSHWQRRTAHTQRCVYYTVVVCIYVIFWNTYITTMMKWLIYLSYIHVLLINNKPSSYNKILNDLTEWFKSIVLTIKILKDSISGIWFFSINAGFSLANVKQTFGFSIMNWFLLNYLHKCVFIPLLQHAEMKCFILF